MTDDTMRAVRFHRHGGPEVLVVDELPIPHPGEGEALVEVRAAGINPGEAPIRAGLFGVKEDGSDLPSGQGSDLAGVVLEVGDGVHDVAPGDEVLGYSWTRSSQATHAVVPTTQLVPKPAGLSWEVAGAMYVVGVTAWAAMEAVELQPGETVVISAAAGGVGDLVTQLAVRSGARVIGIASEANADWLRGRGATPVAYGEGLEQRIRDLAPDGVDAFIDLFGPEYIDLAVALGVRPERIETIISFEAADKIGAKHRGSSDTSNQQVLSAVAGMLDDGSLQLEISATYPLDQVRAAYEQLERRHTRGKIVLIPA